MKFNNVITGAIGNYEPTYAYNIPHHKYYTEENCIAVFFVNRLSDNNDLIRNYVDVKFFRNLTNKDVDTYTIGKYAPNGLYIITTSEENAQEIIEDIKNSPFFLS